MSAIFLLWHLGIGDAIICNGMVRRAARSGWDKVIVPAKPHNFNTVQWMFSDEPRISVIEVGGDEEMQRIGKFGCRKGIGLWSPRGLQMKEWDKAFYEDAGVPFECRWSEFKLPWKTIPPFTPHWPIFWHDDPERGYQIALAAPKYCIYMPSSKEPFQNHIRALQSATEIHVIDSCFLCLADSIATNANRLVLHRYATAKDPYKRLGPPTLRKNWEIIE